MESETFPVYGGQRGGGKIFHLEQALAAKDKELRNVRNMLEVTLEEFKILRDELMRISASDDRERHQVIIRIDYLDLQDSNTAMRVFEHQCKEFLQSFDRKHKHFPNGDCK